MIKISKMQPKFGKYLLAVILLSTAIFLFINQHRYSQPDIPQGSNIKNELKTATVILKEYLSPMSDFEKQYSRLTDEQIAEINFAVKLALKGEPTQAENERSQAVNDIFLNMEIGDAPQGAAIAAIGTRWCIANSINQFAWVNLVNRCTREDVYPEDVKWQTSDVTALVQIAPYYVAGIKYLEDPVYEGRGAYYLQQVVRHHNLSKLQWKDYDFDSVAGDLYLDMVNNAREAVSKIEGTEE